MGSAPRCGRDPIPRFTRLDSRNRNPPRRRVGGSMDWTIKVTDLAIIVATIVGPVLAVQAQKWLERRRELVRRREAVFRALMATRAGPISSAHVNAMNAIPLEFYGKGRGLPEIRAAWDAYMHHVGKSTKIEGWLQKRVDLFVDLLRKLGAACDYTFESAELERGFYAPTGAAEMQSENDTIRQGVAALFRGETTLPMTVAAMPTDPDAVERIRRVLTKIEGWLDGIESARKHS